MPAASPKERCNGEDEGVPWPVERAEHRVLSEATVTEEQQRHGEGQCGTDAVNEPVRHGGHAATQAKFQPGGCALDDLRCEQHKGAGKHQANEWERFNDGVHESSRDANAGAKAGWFRVETLAWITSSVGGLTS